MRRSLSAAATTLLLAACASQPIPPLEPLNVDPLAFEVPQERVAYVLLVPAVLVPPPPEPDSTLPAPPITAICRDGWISYSQHRRGTCAGHGGVRERRNWPAE